MRWNCHILMCRPDHYGISYEINPWMKIENRADAVLAQKQWFHLHHTIIRCGGYVEYIEPQPNLPDMVFTANAGVIHDGKFILSKFLCDERIGEQQFYKEWFKTKYEIIELLEWADGYRPTFEGAGDALIDGELLFSGYGFRTDKRSYSLISEFLSFKAVPCELVDPYFYHLDTCFCPLENDHAIYYPDAFSEHSINKIKNSIEAHAVPENEARKFACNAVIIGKNVILPSGCSNTEHILKRLGFDTHDCDMSEFIKSGGACKCLTLKLE